MTGWLLACSAICLIAAHMTPERQTALRWALGGAAWAIIAIIVSRL